MSDIAVLVPVTTWHAYNCYGGKSLYRNSIDSNSVYEVSTLRPITSVHFSNKYLGHDFNVVFNIYNWFYKEHGAQVYPDYILEQAPELLHQYKTIVLSHHAEYFSAPMKQQLENLLQTRNLIALGGNQIYWKVKWHDNFTRLECRKDATFFNNSFTPGGLWRNSSTSEAAILGAAYTDAGYGTYEPYKVLLPNHFLFNNTNVSTNTIFGKEGIDGRALSGDEMDKNIVGTPTNTVTIAIGNNPNNSGGCFSYSERGSVATLTCGAISCGSGLGYDSTFTKIIENFLFKHN